VARKHEKPHLVQVWQLAETTASGNQLDTFQPWAAHPCGRALLARSVFLKRNLLLKCSGSGIYRSRVKKIPYLHQRI
jgi:hypothetical protein